jgi:hypothetical protein
MRSSSECHDPRLPVPTSLPRHLWRSRIHARPRRAAVSRLPFNRHDDIDALFICESDSAYRADYNDGSARNRADRRANAFSGVVTSRFTGRAHCKDEPDIQLEGRRGGFYGSEGGGKRSLLFRYAASSYESRSAVFNKLDSKWRFHPVRGMSHGESRQHEASIIALGPDFSDEIAILSRRKGRSKSVTSGTAMSAIKL